MHSAKGGFASAVALIHHSTAARHTFPSPARIGCWTLARPPPSASSRPSWQDAAHVERLAVQRASTRRVRGPAPPVPSDHEHCRTRMTSRQNERRNDLSLPREDGGRESLIPHAIHRTAGQESFFAGSRIATHSTWCVIGKMSAWAGQRKAQVRARLLTPCSWCGHQERQMSVTANSPSLLSRRKGHDQLTCTSHCHVRPAAWTRRRTVSGWPLRMPAGTRCLLGSATGVGPRDSR